MNNERGDGEAAGVAAIPREVKTVWGVTVGSWIIAAPLMALLGTALATYTAVVRGIQSAEDSIVHEQQTRETAIGTLSDKIGALAQQEARDIGDIKLQITAVRDDIRVLVSPNPGGRQR